MNKLLKVILVITLASILTSGFAIAGCSSKPAPTPVEELTTYQLEINLLSEKNEFSVDSLGRLESKVEASSADGRISLSLNKGTTVLSQDREPLQIIHAIIDPNPPPALGNAYVVSSVYDLRPKGATFDPPLLLTLSYDPKRLPAGLGENELYVAYQDGTNWYTPSYKRVDAKLHSVTTQLHDFNFSTFAILAVKQPPPSPPSSSTTGTEVGNLAPDFQLSNLEGKPISLSDLRGKPVILNFWATWCHPCVSEMPYLQQVHEEWSARGLVLLAINIDADSSQVSQFLQSRKLSLPVLLGVKTDVADRYNIQYIPTTFFVDKDGIIKAKQVGAFPDKETIEGKLNKIMPG